jgi:hypothetical protein
VVASRCDEETLLRRAPMLAFFVRIDLNMSVA